MTSVRQPGECAEGIRDRSNLAATSAAAIILLIDVFVSLPVFVVIAQQIHPTSLPIPAWSSVIITVVGAPIGAIATCIACLGHGRARRLAHVGGSVLTIPFFIAADACLALWQGSFTGWCLKGVLDACAIAFIWLLMRRAMRNPRSRRPDERSTETDRGMTGWVVGLGGGAAVVGGLCLAPLMLALEQVHQVPGALLPSAPIAGIAGVALIAGILSVCFQCHRRRLARASSVVPGFERTPSPPAPEEHGDRRTE